MVVDTTDSAGAAKEGATLRAWLAPTVSAPAVGWTTRPDHALHGLETSVAHEAQG